MKKVILLSAFLIIGLVGSVWADNKSKTVKSEAAPIQNIAPKEVASPTAYEIDWTSINTGEEVSMSSTSYRAKVTMGQPVSGESQSTNYQIGIGFWYGTGIYCLGRPGDANASNTYTLADPIAIVNYVFNKPGCAPLPLCWFSGLLCRGDWNGSGTVTLADAIRGVNYIFNKPGGPWNAVPIGECCLP